MNKPIYLDTIKLVDKILQTLYDKKFINAKQMKFISGTSVPRARLFYMLPKIHKERHKWSLPHDCSSETYRTAEFIDFYLNPLSITHASYIKDTYDFLRRIRQLNIPQDAMLFTMDVDSLYTNIDIQEGMQAIKNIFWKNPDKKRPDKE